MTLEQKTRIENEVKRKLKINKNYPIQNILDFLFSCGAISFEATTSTQALSFPRAKWAKDTFLITSKIYNSFRGNITLLISWHKSFSRRNLANQIIDLEEQVQSIIRDLI